VKRALILCVIVCCVALSVVAQQITPTSNARLLVTVTGNLEACSPDKISAQVDGTTAQITQLTFAGSTPVDFVLLIDMSNSNRYKSTFEIDTGLELYKQLLTGGHSGYFGDFDDRAYLDPKNSTLEAAAKGFKQMKVGGRTAIYDSVLQAAKFLVQQTRQSKRPRLIFVITDGEDGVSKSTPENAVQQLQTMGIAVHAITLFGDNSDKKRISQFLRLSAETGGTSTVLAQPQKVVPLLLQAIHQQYWITIDSPISPDNKLHSIQFSTTESTFKIHGPSRITLQ